MDYIDTLRIFCSVVETRSFSRAADMLDLSSPTVSRAIAALEQRLGVRLFNRTTRQLSLTGAAERFYDGCVGVLSDLKALEEGASNAAREPIGVLRLVAHTTAAAYWLVPLVASYKQKHPQIRVDVTLTERPVDLVAEGYDVGLVVPFMLMSDSVITRLIKRIAFTIVASPDYLRRHPAPAHPSELAEHKIIASASTIRKPELTFRVGAKQVTIPYRCEIVSNNARFNLEMVQRGFGIGILPIILVQEDLAAGRLVQVLDDFKIVDGATELRLAYNTRALMSAKVRTFIDHAVMQLDASPQIPV